MAETFRQQLDNFILKLQQQITQTTNIIAYIKNVKVPFKQNSYTTAFDKIEENTNTISTIKPKLVTVSNILSQLEELNNELGREINSKKFKFGLQGQLKQQIPETRNIGELPPHVQQIVNEPIVPTPFENRGGKKKRKQKQTRKRR